MKTDPKYIKQLKKMLSRFPEKTRVKDVAAVLLVTPRYIQMIMDGKRVPSLPFQELINLKS